MSEMIERVAEALANRRGQSLATATRAFRITCWEDALVAIEAMREPTQEMCDTGQESPQDHDIGLMSYSVWTGMIDEALK